MADNSKSVDNSQYFTDNRAPTIKSKDTFFYQVEEIDALRWNQRWPYQLMYLKVVNSSDSTNEITYEPTGFIFTLPINPQDLTRGMPIATTVQATLNGIIEEHGGAPFRDIAFNGTTGLTPIKNSAGAKDPNSNELERLLQDTPTFIAGVSENLRVRGQGLNTLTTGQRNNSTILNNGLGEPGDDTKIPEKSTGYYQFRLLEKFIESYVELKKRSGAIDQDLGFDPKYLRLALAIWKDEAVYLCAGVNFTTKRAVANPMEYMYSLQLKAWKRINMTKGALKESDHQPVARRPNGFSDMLNRVNGLDEAVGGIPGVKGLNQTIRTPNPFK